MGRRAEAESLLVETLGGHLRTYGEKHSTVWNTRYNLAMLAMERDDPRTAMEHLRVSIANGATPPILAEGESVFAPLRGDPEFDSLLVVLQDRRAEREDAAP
jgi:hypothetical protein